MYPAAALPHPPLTDAAITNPKAGLVFAAFVPQFAVTEHGSVTTQLAVLCAFCLIAEAVTAGVSRRCGQSGQGDSPQLHGAPR